MNALLAIAIPLLAGCRGPTAEPDGPSTATVDGCLSCHAAEEGPGGRHAAAALGCSRCHLGDPTATVADRAHVGLEREPGALDTAARTCGQAGCHADHLARVEGSMMATASGIIAVDRFAFGEQAVPDGHQAMVELLADPDPSPAEDHLRHLCAGCHLHTRKDNRDDAVQGTGSGCSACHSASRPGRFDAHPTVDLVVPDDRCLGCHSRSGRISLSYAGLSEVRGRDCADPVELHDGRPGCRQPADLHHDAGLACTDCHLHTELMGDGRRTAHEEDATELRCESCHGPDAPETTWAEVEDAPSRRLLRQHGEQRPPTERVRTGRRGTPVWNLRPTAEGWALTPKSGGEARIVPQTPTDDDHARPGHARLRCSACHTRWVPSCPDCHTAYDPDGTQWDFAAAAETPGRWVETGVHFGWSQPALGVRADGTIGPMMPGMLWSLDATGAGGPRLQARRFAAAEPHTTTRSAWGCTDCHASPTALGLGSGTLDLEHLAFTPTRSSPDGIAVDGWTRLAPAQPGASTRQGARSLSAEEQRRVLRVGLCLPCHDGDSAVFTDIRAALRRRISRPQGCTGVVPDWALP
ncbi:MAG: hypothetical protein D6798_07455 [Deltaproteobacteria bacterium]|nr:MAG: hypothetical protein D6798_07455 [Deltaproteobacteria bacterium]